MNVFYEEDGGFKTAAVLADGGTSLQVETPHGKRAKIKANAVLLRFDQPGLGEFMTQAQVAAEQVDVDFLWQCCGAEEFGFEALGQDYFGHTPGAVEAAGLLIKLHGAPMYFYKKGRGRYKAAPAEALQAALAGLEKRRLQTEAQARYLEQLSARQLPDAFRNILQELLYRPDKNSIEWKALDVACAAAKLAPARLLEQCGALPSTHDYHFNRFLFEFFPNGTAFPATGEIAQSMELPLSEAAAFSVDDAATTEIDDAFSVAFLDNGHYRVGIHIAAPALGILPGSQVDAWARARLSTVYMPGNKITMLPEAAIHAYTLGETHVCPALSLYLEVSPEYEVLGQTSCVERIRVAANLRHDTLEQHFNEYTVEQDEIAHPFGKELAVLWQLVQRLEALRGKSDTGPERMDYTFAVENDRVRITERRRGTPIDKLVAELMIYVNAQWGKLLADNNVAGIYRTQGDGKVKMSTVPAPHQGLGVAQYLWSSSPLRRYADLVNQRQLVALLTHDPPPYQRNSADLLAAMRDFEVTYDAYLEFQRHMERYWCLRWLLQEQVSLIGATVIKENLVKLDHLPVLLRVASLPPEVPAGGRVELAPGEIDLLELGLECRYVRRLDAEGVA
ncbi:MAG: ribonuclease catalytic domain-containing protein [Pseudomonadota bacterium]